MSYLEEIKKTKSNATYDAYRSRLRHFIRWHQGVDTLGDVDSYQWEKVSGATIESYAQHLYQNHTAKQARLMFSPLRQLILYLANKKRNSIQVSAISALQASDFDTLAQRKSIKPKGDTFDDLVSALPKTNQAKFISSLNAFLRWKKVDRAYRDFDWLSVTTQELDSYLTEIARNYQQNTFLSYASSLRKLYLKLSERFAASATEEKNTALTLFLFLKNANLTSRTQLKPKERLTGEEITLLERELYTGDPEHSRSMTLISLMLHSGLSMRASRELYFYDDQQRHSWSVTHGANESNEKASVSLAPVTKKQIDSWLKFRGLGDGPLLCHLPPPLGNALRNQEPLSASWSINALNAVDKKLSLKGKLKAKVLKNTYTACK